MSIVRATWVLGLSTLPVAGALAATDFAHIEQLAREFYVGTDSARAASISSTYLGHTDGGLPNSLGIQEVANVTLRLKNGSVARIQLSKVANQWSAVRDLGPDALPEAHPLMVDEIQDAMWRETMRLEQVLAAELESRLQKGHLLTKVRNSYPRCFVELKFGKALCDISYTTWTSDEPECFDTSVLFNRVDGKWVRSNERYHPGMRINPQNGEIFEMIPPKPCAKD
jgi:hypothetical protein